MPTAHYSTVTWGFHPDGPDTITFWTLFPVGHNMFRRKHDDFRLAESQDPASTNAFSIKAPFTLMVVGKVSRARNVNRRKYT